MAEILYTGGYSTLIASRAVARQKQCFRRKQRAAARSNTGLDDVSHRSYVVDVLDFEKEETSLRAVSHPWLGWLRRHSGILTMEGTDSVPAPPKGPQKSVQWAPIPEKFDLLSFIRRWVSSFVKKAWRLLKDQFSEGVSVSPLLSVPVHALALPGCAIHLSYIGASKPINPPPMMSRLDSGVAIQTLHLTSWWYLIARSQLTVA